MKILFVNTFHSLGGGDRTYMFNLANVLENHGHEVAFLAMHHENNIKSKWSEYFVSEIDFKKINKNKNLINVFKVLGRSIYSFESKQKINALIDVFKPDIAHFQTINNHITPSVIHTLKKRNIPIVWTVHDYSQLCPNNTFTVNGQVCEKCLGGKFYNCIINKCTKKSYLASSIAAFSAYFTKFMGLYNHVDLFISPSEFLRAKFIEAGRNPKKIISMPYTVPVETIKPQYEGLGYGLYFGRLADTKGLHTLLDALNIAGDVPFKIAGTGELHKELSLKKENYGLKKLDFLGFKSGESLAKLIRNSSYIVVPSEWYENYPLTIMESFSYGKPVIGANIGGIPEMVKDNETGYLFSSGNEKQLAEKIVIMQDNSDLKETMGQNARKFSEEYHREEMHYEKIIQIYNSLIPNK